MSDIRQNSYTIKNNHHQSTNKYKQSQFLPDIPVNKQNKQVAQSLNIHLQKHSYQRTTSEDHFMKQYSSNHNLNRQTTSTNSSPNQTKFKNNEYKGVRTYKKLYEKQELPNYKEKQRLGRKRVFGDNSQPDMQNDKFSKSDSSKIGMSQNYIRQLVQNEQNKRISLDNYKSIETSHRITQADNQSEANNLEDKITNFEETHENIMLNIKPVLKKTMFYSENNPILTFKSIQIQLIENTNLPQNKSTTLYVPIRHLDSLINLDKNQMQCQIISGIQYNKINNSFYFSMKEQKQNKNLNELQFFPDDIYSSIYINQVQKDYKIIIRFPVIEYEIQSKQFIFIKRLTQNELNQYFEQNFKNWNSLALKQFMKYKGFIKLVKQGTQECINDQESKSQIYLYNDKTYNELKRYFSLQEYQNEIINKSNSKLKGCIQNEGNIRIIKLKGFQVQITGISQTYKFKEEIKTNEWKYVLNYMQKQFSSSYQNPKQLIDKISKKFIDSLIRKEQFKISKIQLQKYNSYSLDDIMTDNLFKSQKRSKMFQAFEDKYLIELRFPFASVSFEGKEYQKKLTEEDCLYLIKKEFQDWKQYLINQHFRVEFNVQANQPLPRIAYKSSRERNNIQTERNLSGMKQKNHQVGQFNMYENNEEKPNEQEKQVIEQTRNKLSAWFPL